VCAKNYYENCLAVDKVITKIIWFTFLAHPVRNVLWNWRTLLHVRLADAGCAFTSTFLREMTPWA